MKLPSIVFAFVLLTYTELSAQITIESDRDEDGNVLFYSENTTLIPYTVLLDFTTLTNLAPTGGGNTVTAIAQPGRIQITKLRPTIAGQGTNYNYSYRFAKGNIYAKNKEEPIYLIPVAEGEVVQAQQMSRVSKTLGKDIPEGTYTGLSFRFENPVAIVAPRKGIVSEMKMDHESSKENLTYSREENFIEIYHEDGSISKVIVLKAGSAKVEVGDLVFPGQVIAEAGGDNYNSGRHVRLVTMRIKKVNTEGFEYDLFPVKLASAEGTVQVEEFTELTVVHPLEVIEMEMKKREKKRYFSEK